ncbi:hypothetical protein NKI12_28140 [Mesorhizobium australicum]|uniref:Uncharacterized protein n=1 Tax=Mesorhizobium australicum TaxID=536018 RepID=A0ACC6T6Y2_9HYPH
MVISRRACSCAGKVHELPVQGIDAFVELLPFGSHLDDERPDAATYGEVVIGEQFIERPIKPARPLGDDVAALQQDRPKLVD